MAGPFGAVEISVQEVDRKRKNGDTFVLLDVREASELGLARLKDGFEHAPMSELESRGIQALPLFARNKDAEIVVFCHLGVRSAQVANWLVAQGWTNVKSMAGGVEAYALFIDPTVGRY